MLDPNNVFIYMNVYVIVHVLAEIHRLVLFVYCSVGEQCDGGPGPEGDWHHRPKSQEEDPACSAVVTQGDASLVTTSGPPQDI